MRRRAFTLLELLVAIAVIALVMGLTSPAVITTIDAGRRRSCSERMRQVCLAADIYRDDNGAYPPAFEIRSGRIVQVLSESLSGYLPPDSACYRCSARNRLFLVTQGNVSPPRDLQLWDTHKRVGFGWRCDRGRLVYEEQRRH